MKFLLFLFIFVNCFCKIHSSNCPNGSQPIPNQNDCLTAVSDPALYLNAVRYCSSIGGIPAKIKTVFENAFLYALVEDFNGLTPYIGVERQLDNTWKYSDGTPLIYQNWDGHEPNLTNENFCTVINPQTGKWKAVDCESGRPFFCTIPGDQAYTTTNLPILTTSTKIPATTSAQNSQCTDGWIYYDETGACYYLQNFTYPDAVHWQLYNWTTAEANCQRMGSHLVSIHSKAEDDFVYSLVTSNVKNFTIAAPNNISCGYQEAWIGYYGNGTLRTGTWTDGTQVDYFGYYWSTSSLYYWAISNDLSCNFHFWHYWYSYETIARFVCKMPSKSRVAKEKLNKRN